MTAPPPVEGLATEEPPAQEPPQSEGGEGSGETLHGSDGDDHLKGHGGDDVLFGGKGDDVLKGGKGDDTFVFDSQAGRDIIKDYQEGEVLRFDGPEFSQDNLQMNQDGKNVTIAFGDQNV